MDMKRRRFGAAALGWLAGPALAAPRMVPGRGSIQIGWDQLAPQDGSLQRYFGSFDRDAVRDWEEDDPRVMPILQRLKAMSRQIPTLAAWEGQLIEIPGYAVLYGDEQLSLPTFFLAPYQGACVHVPPPPGNQLIHVRMAQPIPLLHAAYPLRMRGRLRLIDTDHPVAFSRYALADAQYEHFDETLYPDWLPAYRHL